jgi:hypothetical protein
MQRHKPPLGFLMKKHRAPNGNLKGWMQLRPRAFVIYSWRVEVTAEGSGKIFSRRWQWLIIIMLVAVVGQHELSGWVEGSCSVIKQWHKANNTSIWILLFKTCGFYRKMFSLIFHGCSFLELEVIALADVLSTNVVINTLTSVGWLVYTANSSPRKFAVIATVTVKLS